MSPNFVADFYAFDAVFCCCVDRNGVAVHGIDYYAAQLFLHKSIDDHHSMILEFAAAAAIRLYIFVDRNYHHYHHLLLNCYQHFPSQYRPLFVGTFVVHLSIARFLLHLLLFGTLVDGNVFFLILLRRLLLVTHFLVVHILQSLLDGALLQLLSHFHPFNWYWPTEVVVVIAVGIFLSHLSIKTRVRRLTPSPQSRAVAAAEAAATTPTTDRLGTSLVRIKTRSMFGTTKFRIRMRLRLRLELRTKTEMETAKRQQQQRPGETYGQGVVCISQPTL